LKIATFETFPTSDQRLHPAQLPETDETLQERQSNAIDTDTDTDKNKDKNKRGSRLAPDWVN
jgi:hypothetical protein